MTAEPPDGYDAARDEPYVGTSRVRPYVGSARLPEPAALPGPLGISAYPSSVVDRASSTVDRASSAVDGRAPTVRPRGSELTADDEGLQYFEGRPGQGLADDLADQRRTELPNTRQTEKAADTRRRVMPMWQELPLLLIVSFCVAVLVRAFLVQAFLIPSSSMETTLLIGDRVLVNRVVYETRDPRRGEVIVFRGTDRWAPENVTDAPTGLLDRIGATLGDLVGVSQPGDKDYIKRVIGVPGDRVACCDPLGRVTVNGVAIDEPYLNSNNPLDLEATPGYCGSRRFDEVVVPPGELFVMGDNRGVSLDSRCQGTVPIENVLGRAFLRVWPPSRWGIVH
jgi:signal peptidase I